MTLGLELELEGQVGSTYPKPWLPLPRMRSASDAIGAVAVAVAAAVIVNSTATLL